VTLAEYAASPSAVLLHDRCRIPVEQAVSAHLGDAWQVRTFSDMEPFSSHPAALVSDGRRAFFIKLSEAAHGPDQFQAEMAGLTLLAERAGVRVPAPVGVVAVEGGSILVLEGVQEVPRGENEWREIGRTLARIHQVRGSFCGLETQGYFGPLFQDNRPLPGWLDFYIERRLWPRLVGAIDSGYLPGDVIRKVERLIDRLPGLEIPRVPPVLLHGDAQKNNYISTAVGAVVIDPAVYYGDPEIDLAYIDYFEPVPPAVFHGYQELLPIQPGFAGRRELWRVAAYLAAVQVMGTSQVSKVVQAVEAYL
jgi:protein-ribulosamine 3-kinase